MEKTEKRLYVLGLIGIFVIVSYLLFAKYTEFDLLDWIPPCGIRTLTGFYCPGCGGTRAVRALIEGRLITSFFYHPFVLYCAVIAGIFMVTNTLQIITGNRVKIGMKYRHGYLYAGAAVLIINWILQNIYIVIMLK